MHPSLHILYPNQFLRFFPRFLFSLFFSLPLPAFLIFPFPPTSKSDLRPSKFQFPSTIPPISPIFNSSPQTPNQGLNLSPHGILITTRITQIQYVDFSSFESTVGADFDEAAVRRLPPFFFRRSSYSWTWGYCCQVTCKSSHRVLSYSPCVHFVNWGILLWSAYFRSEVLIFEILYLLEC